LNYVVREPVGGEALQDGWSHVLSLQCVLESRVWQWEEEAVLKCSRNES